MKFSICIPTLSEREKSLNRAIESIEKQSYKNFEIILIWKGDKEPLVAHYGYSLRIKKQESDSVAGAINEGLALATGDVFVRTDDDCIFDAYWLENMKNTYEKFPNTIGVTGVSSVPKDRMSNRDVFKQFPLLVERIVWEGQRMRIGKHFKSGATSIGSDYALSWDVPGCMAVDFMQNCNWSMRIEKIREYGGFPERYGGLSEYCQEIALYKRKSHELLIWNPNAIVYHMVESSDSRRLHAFNRLKNFWMFWHECIKPNGGSYPRFLFYFMLQAGYYLCKKLRLI